GNLVGLTGRADNAPQSGGDDRVGTHSLMTPYKGQRSDRYHRYDRSEEWRSTMSFLMTRPWLRRSMLALVAVLGVGGTLTANPAPANARVWVSVGGPWGGYYYGSRHYYYGHAYPVYYGRYLGRPDWRGAYNLRHDNWCRWHPYRCGW